MSVLNFQDQGIRSSPNSFFPFKFYSILFIFVSFYIFLYIFFIYIYLFILSRGAISVTDFGADPSGGKDSFDAFTKAVAQGMKSNQVHPNQRKGGGRRDERQMRRERRGEEKIRKEE